MRGKSISLRAAWLSYLRINQGPLTRVGKEYGLGTAKAAQLKAALEIGRRLGLTQLDEKYQIKSPADAANLVMMEMAFLDHEHSGTHVPVPISTLQPRWFCLQL
jgi:hypothetical protein